MRARENGGVFGGGCGEGEVVVCVLFLGSFLESAIGFRWGFAGVSGVSFWGRRRQVFGRFLDAVDSVS